MTGAWVGKARCLTLWKTINEYVSTYVAINETPTSTPWYARWNELVTKYKILEKRDFEFLAFVITGTPDATVLDCIHTLIELIPNLSDHLTIKYTNDNGNVQYEYTPLNRSTQQVSKLTDDNPFSILKNNSDDDDSNTTHNLPPNTPDSRPDTLFSNIPTQDSNYARDTSRLYESALETAESTLNALTDAKINIAPTDTANTFDTVTNNAIANVTKHCDEQLRTLKSTIQLLQDEYFSDFCSKCDQHCRNLADDFDKAMNTKFAEYESKIKTFESKLTTLEQKINTSTNRTQRPSPIRSQPNPRQTPTKPNVKPSSHTFGPTKSPYQNNRENTIPHYFKSSIEFWHQADRYFLLDKEYLKNSPKLESPSTVNDALSIYSQIQKNALIYNIFVTPIDDVSIWDYSPTSVPTTCNLDVDDTSIFQQVYQRSAVALYTKLQSMDVHNVQIFKQLIIHERSSQDGYRVLYAMLCGCHPRLVEKTKLDPPKFKTNGNLFTFIRDYSNYIEYERISKRNYSDLEKLTFVIDALELDGRFEKALASIKLRKNTYEEMTKLSDNSSFPPALTLDTLPYTIMQCYTPKEKSDFFNTTPHSVATVQAINQHQQTRSYQQRQPASRQSVNSICLCCGVAGHDVGTTGCDFAASFIMTNAYLRNNNNQKNNIITKFKDYQKRRLHNMTSRRNLSTRIQKKIHNKRIGLSPQMKLLVDAISEEIESDLNDSSIIPDTPDIHTLAVFDLVEDPTPEEFHDTSDSTPDVISE